jgi:type I restriction enzyme S subunit
VTEIPKTRNWETITLSDIGTWRGGGTPSKSNDSFWTNGTIPWVSPKDMKTLRIDSAQDLITEEAVQKSSAKMIPAQSVAVVTRSGILERTLPVAIIEVEAAVNQDLKVVTPKEGIDPAFVAYYLRGYERDILRQCSKNGTTVASIDFPRFLRFPFPLPDIDEQKQIVEAIESQFTRLDDAVAALQRSRTRLKRYRASVLKAACEGRLVPTEAEVARQEGRSYESASVLLEHIKSEREAVPGKKPKSATPVDTSRMPDLPEGWAWTSVSQLNPGDRKCAYGVLQPGPDVDGGVPLVRVGDINNGAIKLDNLKHISPSITARYPRTKLQGGEVLISLVGAIGRTAVVPASLTEANVARAVGVIPLVRAVNPRWVEIWFRNPERIREMDSKSHEVARKTLNLEDVRETMVALPPVAEQEHIVEDVERRLSVIEQMEATVETNLKRTESLRQSILRMAFSGALVKHERLKEISV